MNIANCCLMGLAFRPHLLPPDFSSVMVMMLSRRTHASIGGSCYASLPMVEPPGAQSYCPLAVASLRLNAEDLVETLTLNICFWECRWNAAVKFDFSIPSPKPGPQGMS